eukprot:UN25356
MIQLLNLPRSQKNRIHHFKSYINQYKSIKNKINVNTNFKKPPPPAFSIEYRKEIADQIQTRIYFKKNTERMKSIHT